MAGIKRPRPPSSGTPPSAKRRNIAPSIALPVRTAETVNAAPQHTASNPGSDDGDLEEDDIREASLPKSSKPPGVLKMHAHRTRPPSELGDPSARARMYREIADRKAAARHEVALASDGERPLPASSGARQQKSGA